MWRWRARRWLRRLPPPIRTRPRPSLRRRSSGVTAPARSARWSEQTAVLRWRLATAMPMRVVTRCAPPSPPARVRPRSTVLSRLLITTCWRPSRGLTIEATEGSAFSGVVARFTDSDLLSPAGDFTAMIEWGDGTSSPGTLAGANGSFTVSGTHSYATAGKLPVHVTLRDDAGTATAVASGSALVVSPTTLALIDPLYGAVADLLGPFFQGFFGVTNERIGLLTTIPATEGEALTLPNILGDVPLPPDIPDVALTSIPVAAFIDGNPADTAADFIALINWGDGSTTPGAVTLVASQDFDAAPGFVPPLHAAVFMVTGTHTYADERASEPLSVGIIRTSDNLSGTLHRSATI